MTYELALIRIKTTESEENYCRTVAQTIVRVANGGHLVVIGLVVIRPIC